MMHNYTVKLPPAAAWAKITVRFKGELDVFVNL